MKVITQYTTIALAAEGNFSASGSKFLAHAYPVQDESVGKDLRTMLRKAHPKAVHVVYAARYGFDGTDEKWSDDGEPSGSSAQPILNTLRSRELVRVAVFVVRYFGGKKLGVPGLIHAYRTAAEQALDAAGVLVCKIMDTFSIACNESDLQTVLQVVHRLPVTVQDLQYGERCTFNIRFEKERTDIILPQLEKIWQAEIQYLYSV